MICKKVLIKDARALLESNGFFVGNLWHIDDVKSKFNCTDDEAQDVLTEALENEATMDRIWFAIEYFGQDFGLELKNEKDDDMDTKQRTKLKK